MTSRRQVLVGFIGLAPRGAAWQGNGNQAVSLTVLRLIPLRARPTGLLLNAAMKELYVTGEDGSLFVISTREQRVVRTIRIDNSRLPRQFSPIETSADGTTAFLRGLDSLVTVALASGKFSSRKCPGLTDIALAKDGSGLFLAAAGAGLLKLDFKTDTVHVINPVPAPTGLALTPDGRFLFVSYQSGGLGGRWGHDAIGKFDAASGALIKSITNLANVGGSLAISPDGKQLWANGLDACQSRRYDHLGCPIVPGGIINVLETSSGGLIQRIGLAGPHPHQLAFNPSGTLLAANGDGLRIIDTRTFQAVASKPALSTTATVFEPDDDFAYISLDSKNAVAILRLASQSKPLK